MPQEVKAAKVLKWPRFVAWWRWFSGDPADFADAIRDVAPFVKGRARMPDGSDLWFIGIPLTDELADEPALLREYVQKTFTRYTDESIGRGCELLEYVAVRR